ncbi:MAG: hypothetical protein MI748_01465 [Opitutales bacterium]|nr:hypothetical protein [Opitutales bacterium]
MADEEEAGICERCGIKTTDKLGDAFVCDSCYEIRGSCCTEFGPDDLAEHSASED